MKKIRIQNACEKNLKHISLELPREKFIVVTGLSGSGKTTLVKDTLFMEAQRQYLEALGMQGIQKPKVDSISNLSPAILIGQEDRNQNPRSTLGTQTDIYTDLRMVFEKLHTRTCPFCHTLIKAPDSKEETEKIGDQFYVYMYCPHCGKRMDKLTRTNFSFNTKEGACPACHGFGTVQTINDSVYNKARSLEDGAVAIWPKSYADYQRKSFYKMLESLALEVPADKPLKDYTARQFELLKQGVHAPSLTEKEKAMIPRNVLDGHFEGLETKLWEKIASNKGVPDALTAYITDTCCPACKGEKLNPESREAEVFGERLPVIETWSLKHLASWLSELEANLTPKEELLVHDYLLDMETKIGRISQVGLDYLSLNRQYRTLSGGEGQRIKLAAVLDSQMTGLIYMLDEPTIGLHPKDTNGLIAMIRKLRDNGNTVIVIEHDEQVIQSADFVLEMGPKSGIYGGEVIGAGTYEQLADSPVSLLAQSSSKEYEEKSRQRDTDTPAVTLKEVSTSNLKHLSLTLPANCLTVITGVSGSGKSSLLFDEVASSGLQSSEKISWQYTFKKMITIDQKRPARNKRSVIATYVSLFDEIRKLFAKEAGKENKPFKAGDFSFNSGNGRCPSCQGLGVIESNQLFFENIEVTCPDCQGSRYTEEILGVTVNGKNIREVLELSIVEAIEFFQDLPVDKQILELLVKTNLDYVKLGQGADTLSGGEMQRLQLASAISKESGGILFIMDEPTTGLHKIDVHYFMKLIQELVDAGNTFFFIEHNLDVISQADYVAELGPVGGEAGGYLTFCGSMADFLRSGTVTGEYLRRYREEFW